MASELRVGDKIRQGPYTVEVVDDPVREKDLFGRDLVRFPARIVNGPDRIGERGLVSFGPDGHALIAPRK